MNEPTMQDKYAFGFWIYLMTDLVMFAALFAAYAVLRNATFGEPSAGELFGLNNALAETLILLTSSFTCGLAMLAVRAGKKTQVLALFTVTLFLGLAFLGLELTEFSKLIAEGNGPQRSAALSSFFTLVGAHGLHITFGLLWIVVALIQIKLRGLSEAIVSKVTRFGLFWHFLDIVWIFIFTIVYLLPHA